MVVDMQFVIRMYVKGHRYQWPAQQTRSAASALSKARAGWHLKFDVVDKKKQAH